MSRGSPGDKGMGETLEIQRYMIDQGQGTGTRGQLGDVQGIPTGQGDMKEGTRDSVGQSWT